MTENLRMLLVDDNIDLADGMAALLEDEVAHLDVAYNGEQAMALAEKNRYDLVLMDIKLGDTDGVNLTHRIRLMQAGIRVVLMTGFRLEQVLGELVNEEDALVVRIPGGAAKAIDLLARQSDEALVLIADCMDPCHEILEEAKKSGIELRVVQSRQALLDEAKQHPNAGFLIDIQQTVIDSLEMYVGLREQLGPRKLLIRVPGHSSETGADSLKDLKSTGCLFKPFDPEQVVDIIEAM